MISDLVKKTSDYVRLKLLNEHTGHDWCHVERVWKTAKMLQETEGGNLELLELATLLHDLGDYKKYNFSEKKGGLALSAMMDVLEIEEEKQRKIIRIISEAEYKGGDTKVPSTIEGKILQDADNLDALGAIGVARTFATGGFIKRMMHDPKRKVRHKLCKEDFQLRKQEGTSLNYFYEKVLKLPSVMNTKKARVIAEKRVEFVKLFIDNFLLECKGEK